MLKKLTKILPVLAVSIFYAGLAHAGSGGTTEFGGLYDLLVGWTEGTLGKIIAVSMFLIGVATGVARQSLMAIAIGIGGAVAVAYTPTVIDGIVTAIM